MVSDVKVPTVTGGAVTDLTADVVSATDYFPGGSIMSGRSFNSNSYRYGAANGSEKDDEIAGNGNIYTAKFWQYDSRLLRRWNVDPVVKPYESPYATFANNPIWFIDPSGADTTLYAQGSGEKLDTKISDSEKTPIWVVNTQAKNYDANNPWATAKPLTYYVGHEAHLKNNSKKDGLSGNTFRDNHPLKGIGTTAGQQVFEEDLLDLTTEFNAIIVHGLPSFTGMQSKFFPDIQFKNLVTDDAKFDLKSRITSDGTPSYSAAVIGDYAFYNGTLRMHDDFGNISYGAFGLEAGYHKSTLLMGSNINQWWKDLLGNTKGAGDTQRDIDMMNLGFKLYKQGAFNKK